jgi:CheY-like chemotaxis protein
MATHEVVTINDLEKQIQTCASKQFTGRLDLVIQDIQGLQWSLYFWQGGLFWCASEVHPMRRWCRQLSYHCPELAVDSKAYTETSNASSSAAPWLTLRGTPQGSAVAQESLRPQCWDFHSLADLVRQQKVLQWKMAAIVEGNITEILFDILQQWEQVRYRSALQLTYRLIPEDTKHGTLVLIQANQAWQQTMQAWQAWQQAGLAEVSPNRAPVIWQADKLQQQTSPVVYRNLSDLVKGNQTLRDLAVKMKQKLLPLTQSIMPYIREGLIGLIEVEDFNYAVKPAPAPNSVLPPGAPPVSPVQPQSTGILVAYIDDSRIDSLAMSHILTQAGYRFLNVQDPVKALPLLLEHKPDLIFLDLVMPVANGYEICAQIRRISAFKDTPVIILTSNDGIVDRVRAKMVGSSGFLAKPIDAEKVLKILHRHLAASTPVQS